MIKIISRAVYSQAEALKTAQDIVDAGGTLISITYNGLFGGHNTMPSPGFIVWASYTDSSFLIKYHSAE